MVWWLYVKNIHSLRRFSTLVRIGGGGYRVLAKLSHTRSRNFERYVHQTPGSQWLSIRIVAWQSELSLPYLRGFIISFLLKEMKPSFGFKGSSWWILSNRKSPGLPWAVFAQELDEGLASVRPLVLECREFTGCFLKWLLFCISLWERKKWRIWREPSELIRFCLFWKIYDLVAEKGVAWSPPCLQEHLPGFRGGRSLLHGFLSRAWWFNPLGKESSNIRL